MTRHAASTNLESALFCVLTGTLFGAADSQFKIGQTGGNIRISLHSRVHVCQHTGHLIFLICQCDLDEVLAC
jgi:hypothetical protein